MALIKCPECGKEVSDSAKSCPNCGWLKESKVIIYGITQRFLIGGTLKIFVDGILKAKVGKREKVAIPVEHDCTITAQCGINPLKGKVQIKGGRITTIKFEYDRITGVVAPRVIDNCNNDSIK